ncbi:MAG: hypothetical protein HOO00_00530 [Rhodospirillaceae bacterium]|jgi:hypothetical protein|nr:hypothetical protein [Rhodospirillaceae bacterium]MBT5374267.1 hypothetical protein [Rhodospirillaceae bacterium]MBT5752674.1 hypothetical protein [Rhodospirillaceae bacterium]
MAFKRERGEVLIEFRRVGKYVKVSAIDPVSLIEVSIVGDPKRSDATLKRLAAEKLNYVLNKRGKNGKE